MKAFLVFTLVLVASLSSLAQNKVEYYTCPMHPEIRKDAPGKCPKCGMTLVKKTEKKVQVKKPAPTKSMPAKEESHKDHNMPESDSLKGDPVREVTQKEEAAVSRSITRKTVSAPQAQVVRYELHVADTIVNYTGKERKAIAINGSIPAPTLEFHQGDTAEITVTNHLKVETMIHWHGIILPNAEDGVPYLTTAPIKPGKSRLFRFPVVQNGTYWYHSHSRLQEQSGMYGALIFKKREEPDLPTYTMVLSDWTDMKPYEVDRRLHNQSDWFSIKKNSVQSYAEAIGSGNFKTKITNEWKRMLAMDVSDVAYDQVWINGMQDQELGEFKKGDKVRLRIVNGGASTYFWLKWSGGKMTVLANDGEDVQPVDVDRLIIAVAETYDVMVEIPEDMNYQFLATSEDRTRSSSLWLGKGMKMPADRLPRLEYFKGMEMMNGMMKMNGDMMEMEGMTMTNQIMDMNTVMYPELHASSDSTSMPGMKEGHQGHNMSSSSEIKTLNYSMLKAPGNTELPKDWTKRTFEFNLTGNMNRYVWTLDNKTVSEAEKIWIKKGENIRIILFNNTMMRHPMHLHGHFFRVLNGQGANAPLKNVLDIMPMERDTIEFAATESGDWFFHCHILYHMMSGMGRIFSYENSLSNPELPNARLAQRKLFKDDREFHPMAEIALESNGSEGEVMLANTRWKVASEWHLGYSEHHGYESETYVGRYFGKMQWLYGFAGFDYHYKAASAIRKDEVQNSFGQLSNKNNRKTGIIGVQYVLPLLVVAELRFDLDSRYRFQLMRNDIPVTKRLRMNFMVNTDKEYSFGLGYRVGKLWSISSHYDSDMGLGAGLTLNY